MNSKWYFKSTAEGLARKLQEGVTTNIFFGKNIMLSIAKIEPNTTSTIHSHPEEQWGYLLEGECVRIQNGEEVPMKKGDFWHTPPDSPHGVRTGKNGATIMDIFSPREAPIPSQAKDWLPPSTRHYPVKSIPSNDTFSTNSGYGTEASTRLRHLLGNRSPSVRGVYDWKSQQGKAKD